MYCGLNGRSSSAHGLHALAFSRRDKTVTRRGQPEGNLNIDVSWNSFLLAITNAATEVVGTRNIFFQTRQYDTPEQFMCFAKSEGT